ncbi:MAG: CAP domain-containing protein, partial [bacterium]
GLPGDVTLDATLSAKDQQMALMMIAQGDIFPDPHHPPNTWKCWTAEGAEAASNSNLSQGRHGPAAINDGYMTDPGAGNTALGHRRWILYPPQVTMGTGSTDAVNGGYHGSNALWVLGMFGTRPPTPEWVAWPPAGYIPYQVVYARWSFSRPSADFSAATVTMTQGATPISLSQLPIAVGYGDPTIGWEPAALGVGASVPDKKFTVTVSNVMISAAPQDFTYDVTIIDPAIASPERVAWMIY